MAQWVKENLELHYSLVHENGEILFYFLENILLFV